VLRLRSLVEQHTPSRPSQWSAADERIASYVVIEAANLWEGYCRSFYLSSALRAFETPGVRVTVTFATPIRTLQDALTVAVHRIDATTRGRQGPWSPSDEPDWPNKGHFRIALAHVGASNLPKVDRALGLLPSALNDLRTMRNYFAHKAERSASSVRRLPRNYRLTQVTHPMVFLFSPAPGRGAFTAGEPVLFRWLDALYRTIRLTTAPL
jgi:hypothetical protein